MLKKGFTNSKNQRGQIAVIITLIIAAVFLLTMVFINIYKVSTSKTSTSQAADKTALRIASKLGSLSNAYLQALSNLGLVISTGITYDAVNKTAYLDYCGFAWNLDWWDLPKLAAVVVATIAAFAITLNPVFLLTGIGLFVSMTMMNGITQKFQDMSAYNSIREDALFQAMRDLQTDYVELKNLVDTDTGKRTGVFQDPADPSSPTYDLTAVPGMKDAIKVPRFLAWYYTKRWPLVDESALKAAIDKFINGFDTQEKDGIRKFVYIDDWDAAGWRIRKLSYRLLGKGSYTVGEFDVTCPSGSCPGWVIDPVTDSINLISLKLNSDELEDAADKPWFLKDKLDGCWTFCPLITPCTGLLRRLHCDYKSLEGDVFCSTTTDIPCANPIVNRDDFDKVKEDMRLLLVRIKETINLPNAERLRGVMQWFSFFYDPTMHNADRTSKDPNPATMYDHDIYLRLARDKLKIAEWITGLKKIDADYMQKNIPPHYDSYCFEGKGGPPPSSVVDAYCYTKIDDCLCNHIECDSCGNCETVCNDNPEGCINSKVAVQYGIYGTCAGNDPYASHPVCQAGRGDLYSTIPAWCSIDDRTVCVSLSDDCENKTCGIPGENLGSIITEYNYQGQMSWRPYDASNYDWDAGPSEVKQAIQILEEWYEDLSKFQMIIADLQDEIDKLAGVGIRNAMVYAWTDSSASVTSMPQYSHVVSIGIKDYPERLPYITEKLTFGITWLGTCKRKTLHNYFGVFEITAARYDQDQPNKIWDLRRRQNPLTAQADVDKLGSIVIDIQKNGTIKDDPDLWRYLFDILTNDAVISKTRVRYGPKKEDIAIINTDMP